MSGDPQCSVVHAGLERRTPRPLPRPPFSKPTSDVGVDAEWLHHSQHPQAKGAGIKTLPAKITLAFFVFDPPNI